MSTTTPNLNLFKYNPTTDGKETFSIETALNNNWDKIDNLVSGSSGASGYGKLGNGLIINYGKAATGSQDIAFEQPTLSANGTMGGTSFAVSCNGYYASGYEAWRAFNGNTSDYWDSTMAPSTITMYNPTPLKVSKLRITNWSAQFPNAGSVQASNDNSTWTSLVSGWTNSNYTVNATWDINVNSTNYYKYYRLTVSSNTVYNNGVYTCIANMQMVGTYTTTVGKTITFPLAFTNTNYAYSLAYLNGEFGKSYATSMTKTGITIQNNSTATNVYYIAVGY